MRVLVVLWWGVVGCGVYPHGLVFPKWWSLFGHLYHCYPQRPNIHRIPVALLKSQLGPIQSEFRVVFWGGGRGQKRMRKGKTYAIQYGVPFAV